MMKIKIMIQVKKINDLIDLLTSLFYGEEITGYSSKVNSRINIKEYQENQNF